MFARKITSLPWKALPYSNAFRSFTTNNVQQHTNTQQEPHTIQQAHSSHQHTTQQQPHSTSTASDYTHFGFQTVPKEDKQSLVGEVFHKVANTYDVMNDVMSLGIHRWWKDEFVSRLGPSPGSKLLDVAGGTGDIAFRCVDKITSSPVFFPRPAHMSPDPTKKKIFSEPSIVTVFDINPSMLEVGKARAEQRGYHKLNDPKLEWVEGNAEKLPFEDKSMDAYTIAFGIRNCTNIFAVLQEAYRVLKPGGRFLCLEFSHLNSAYLQQAYDWYSFNLIPVWGQLIANDYASYQYLVESIRKFPDQQTFLEMIQLVGFKLVTVTDLTFGVVAVHSGWKL